MPVKTGKPLYPHPCPAHDCWHITKPALVQIARFSAYVYDLMFAVDPPTHAPWIERAHVPLDVQH
jgi:hypothetical protein